MASFPTIIPAGENSIFRLHADNFIVERNDIIGIQYNALNFPVTCSQDGSNLDWQQSAILQSQNGWILVRQNVVPLAKSTDRWVDGIVCNVMAISLPPMLIQLPLISPAGAKQNLTVKLSNSVSNLTHVIQIVYMQELENLSFIHPTMMNGEDNLITVQAYKSTRLAFSLDKGSNAILRNNRTLHFFSFTSCTNDAFAAFAGISKLCVLSEPFSFPVTKVAINFTAFNNFSSISTVIKIMSVQNVSGLTLLSNSNQTVIGKTNFFRASVQTGSNVIYQFIVNGFNLTQTSGSFQYLFNSLGKQSIQVRAKNVISPTLTKSFEIMVVSAESLTFKDCCDNSVFPSNKNIPFDVIVGPGIDESSQTYTWCFYQCPGKFSQCLKLLQCLYSKNVSYVFKKTGFYSVTVVSQDSHNNKENLMGRFEVQEEISSVSIYTMLVSDIVYVGQMVTFLGIIRGGSSVNFQWEILSDGGNYSIHDTSSNRMRASFSNNQTYYIRVTASNDVSDKMDEKKIDTVLCRPPQLQLVGSTLRKEKRSRMISIEVVVQTCVLYKVTHQWCVYNGNCSFKEDVVNLSDSISLDTPTLHVPPRTLDYGSYCVQFTSTYEKPYESSSLFVDLNVEASQLKAIIAGGDERIFAVHDQITLDGSLSYDPDKDKDSPAKINYNWTCQELVSIFLFGE